MNTLTTVSVRSLTQPGGKRYTFLTFGRLVMTSLSKSVGRGSGRVTIRDVAQQAGVGIKTVSRVINGEPNVSAATTERVKAAIAQLQWEPDSHASNLRRTHTRTKSIGLLLG